VHINQVSVNIYHTTFPEKRSGYKTIIKRFFLGVIILFFINNLSLAQSFMLSSPLSEPLLSNPAFIGAYECNQVRLNYKKQLNYDFSSFSYNRNIEKYGISSSLLFTNLTEGKSINTLNIKGIVAKEIKLNIRNILYFAFEAAYFQQNIFTGNLIFRHMADPLNQTYTNAAYLYNFEPEYRSDFAAGMLYLNPNIRTGISFQNISALYNPDTKLRLQPTLNFHFGKSFRLGAAEKEELKKIIIPEVFIQYRPDNLRFAYGASIYTNHVGGSFFIKQGIKGQTFSPAANIQLHYGVFSFGYGYDLSLNKYILQPLSSHSVFIVYNFRCSNKRNEKNTIFCKAF
jgi:type IX secretion system PorP/SprF family membrane protein